MLEIYTKQSLHISWHWPPSYVFWANYGGNWFLILLLNHSNSHFQNFYIVYIVYMKVVFVEVGKIWDSHPIRSRMREYDPIRVRSLTTYDVWGLKEWENDSKRWKLEIPFIMIFIHSSILISPLWTLAFSFVCDLACFQQFLQGVGSIFQEILCDSYRKKVNFNFNIIIFYSTFRAKSSLLSRLKVRIWSSNCVDINKGRSFYGICNKLFSRVSVNDSDKSFSVLSLIWVFI